MADETKPAVEEELDRALARLPVHAAPSVLRRRLEALVATEAAPIPERQLPGAQVPQRQVPERQVPERQVPERQVPERQVPERIEGRRARAGTLAASFVSACAAAALVLVATRVAPPRPAAGAPSELVAEAVNDHIRVISSAHPVDIENGGIHQVKPWFTGRLDFAPRVAFSGDADFPLVGGSVGYFRDRKAAVFVFKRRLHTITLLVMPPEGLTWPDDGVTRLGRLSVSEANARGFSVLMWRDGGLGYVLVSDVNAHDLEALALKINGD